MNDNIEKALNDAYDEGWLEEEMLKWWNSGVVENLSPSTKEWLMKKFNIKEKEPMTINEYQQLALRTEPPTDSWKERITNGLMGLNGEAGEAIDILKKHLFHKHPLDKKHLAKELGDVAWYIAVSADTIGYTLEEIFEMNIAKLRARYPEGFDSERSIHRQAGDI